MSELDRWQEDARAVLDLQGAGITWEAINQLAATMRRNHARLAGGGLFERDRVSAGVRRQRQAAIAQHKDWA